MLLRALVTAVTLALVAAAVLVGEPHLASKLCASLSSNPVLVIPYNPPSPQM